MKSALISEEYIVASEADRYGHLKKTCPTRLSAQVKRNWIRGPQADRFGHVTNPNQSATLSQYPKP